MIEKRPAPGDRDGALSAEKLGGAADRAGPADLTLEQQFAFGLREAAPDAVRLADLEGMCAALRHDRALAAHLLGAPLTLQAGPAALAVWMEEHRRIDPTAKAL